MDNNSCGYGRSRKDYQVSAKIIIYLYNLKDYISK